MSGSGRCGKEIRPRDGQTDGPTPVRCRLSRARPPLPPPPPTTPRRPYHLARRPARPVRCGPSTNISIDERPPPAPVARHRTFAPPSSTADICPSAAVMVGVGYGGGGRCPGDTGVLHFLSPPPQASAAVAVGRHPASFEFRRRSHMTTSTTRLS